MKNEEEGARDRVLKVTIQLLFKSEPEEITIRQIAAEAGVNVAAVNYYFRSKELLIDEAVLSASQAALEQGLAILKNKDLPPEERLRMFYAGYAKGLVEFQGITKTAFRSFLTRGHGQYAALMQEMLSCTIKTFEEMDGNADPQSSARKALLLFSGVAFPFLVLEVLKGATPIDYYDAGARIGYIDLILEILKGKKE